MFKGILRWVAIGGVLAVPVIIPFIVSASMFFPYITGKNFTFRVIVEIALAAWTLLALMDAKYRPRFSWVLASLTLFVAVVGIADLFGQNAFKSFWSNFERMEGYVALLHLYAYFVVASSILNTERLWNTFWYSSLVASVAIVLIGFKSLFSATTDLSYTLAITRIDATFGNPIYLAVYALFHIFIAFVLMARWRGTHWHQVILGLVALLHLCAMILTQTRGTVLGFVGGALITAILIALLERSNISLRRLSIGALAVLMLVVGTGFAIRDQDFAKTMPVLSRFTQMKFSEGTINARFMNWGIAWQGVKERPLLGWGQDNYEYVFAKHFDPNMYGQEPWFDRTHDLIFDWLIASGFLGLGAYLLVQFSLIGHLWVLDPRERVWSLKSLTSFSALKALVERKSGSFSATERALWTGLLAAYFFHNLFVFDNIVSYILFFSVLAYLQWRVTEAHAPISDTKEMSEEVAMSVALPVTAVVASLVVWYLNVPGIKTATALIDALIPQRVLASGQTVSTTPEEILAAYEQALSYDQLGRQEVREQIAQTTSNILRSPNVKEETKAKFRDMAIASLEKEVARNPDSVRLLLFMGTLYHATGRIDDAERTFARAAELSPQKQATLLQYAQIELITGKNDAALDILKRVYDLAPEYEEARIVYAIGLIRAGKDKEAVDLLTEWYGSAAYDDQRLFNEWTNAKRYDIAAMILEARVAKNPDDVQQQVSLAVAYKQLGRKAEAVKILQNVSAVHPEYKTQMDGFIKEVRGY